MRKEHSSEEEEEIFLFCAFLFAVLRCYRANMELAAPRCLERSSHANLYFLHFTYLYIVFIHTCHEAEKAVVIRRISMTKPTRPTMHFHA